MDRSLVAALCFAAVYGPDAAAFVVLNDGRVYLYLNGAIMEAAIGLNSGHGNTKRPGYAWHTLLLRRATPRRCGADREHPRRTAHTPLPVRPGMDISCCSAPHVIRNSACFCPGGVFRPDRQAALETAAATVITAAVYADGGRAPPAVHDGARRLCQNCGSVRSESRCCSGRLLRLSLEHGCACSVHTAQA